jgi:methylase of polypeptide subunit release factors
VLALLPRQGHLVDIGTGAGVGALAAASLLPDTRITMTDINPAALELAAINWAHSRLPTPHIVRGDALAAVTDEIDIVIANPPYIADAAHRAYRDGGGMHGASLSVRWADDAARRLPSGGALALYTGSAIVGGEDPLREALIDVLGDFDVRYEEIDPDVFGEELEREDYEDVERIAVVGVVAIKR